MPAEDVPVRDPPLFQRVLQGARHMRLADHVSKMLRPVLTRQDLVSHEGLDYMRVLQPLPSASAPPGAICQTRELAVS